MKIIFNTLVVGEDGTLFYIKVMSPNFEGKDNCCKFQVMSGIIFLILLELLRSVGITFPFCINTAPRPCLDTSL